MVDPHRKQQTPGVFIFPLSSFLYIAPQNKHSVSSPSSFSCSILRRCTLFVRVLETSTIFSIKRNQNWRFKRIFLETAFPRTVSSISQNLIDQLAHNFTCTFSTCVTIVPTTINSRFLFLIFFRLLKLNESTKKPLIKFQSVAIFFIFDFLLFFWY